MFFQSQDGKGTFLDAYDFVKEEILQETKSWVVNAIKYEVEEKEVNFTEL